MMQGLLMSYGSVTVDWEAKRRLRVFKGHKLTVVRFLRLFFDEHAQLYRTAHCSLSLIEK
jgi:hypothetical protein